ncbi:hypothetical protein ACLKA6_016940 [Drosophila palustris]
MASKRKQNFGLADSEMFKKKHTLDSDEEDSDDYERDNLNDSDIEGGEEGVGKVEDDVKITPFNMREELEEGHFDKEGHYHWNKESEIKDNWLDNIDWVKVEKDKNYFDPNNDEQNSADAALPTFNLSVSLRKMVEFMKPGESVQMALQRLGRKRPKLTTLEKLKQKKAGIENSETQQISKLTEVANEILSNTGNMDIYQETYEKIMRKLEDLPGTSKQPAGESFDMYADDFEEKESKRLKTTEKEDEPNTNEINIGSKPLQLWDKKVRNGHIKRITDNDIQSLVLEIVGTNVSTTFITCPADPKKTLGIKLPFLVMIIKNMKKYFTFEVQVLDDKNVRRRFRASNYQSTTRVKPFICTMPMRLDEGWNQIQFNLSDFTRRAYGTNYVETLRVQIHANCRIRRVYFSDRLYSEDELPPEFKLFLPIQKPVQKSNAICS